MSIQHIAFNCKDMRAQEESYTKHFAFKRARTFNKGKSDEFLMIRLGGACMELFQAGADDDAGGEQRVGFKHLAIEVDDIEKVVAGLKADGIATDDVIDCSGIVPGMKVCFFNDREGNRIEIMQGYADE